MGDGVSGCESGTRIVFLSSVPGEPLVPYNTTTEYTQNTQQRLKQPFLPPPRSTHIPRTPFLRHNLSGIADLAWGFEE